MAGYLKRIINSPLRRHLMEKTTVPITSRPFNNQSRELCIQRTVKSCLQNKAKNKISKHPIVHRFINKYTTTHPQFLHKFRLLSAAFHHSWNVAVIQIRSNILGKGFNKTLNTSASVLQLPNQTFRLVSYEAPLERHSLTSNFLYLTLPSALPFFSWYHFSRTLVYEKVAKEICSLLLSLIPALDQLYQPTAAISHITRQAQTGDATFV